MPYRYTFSYNDACGCHPEYLEVECEGETAEELAVNVAAELARCPRARQEPDVLDVHHRRDTTEAEREAFTRAFEAAVAPARAAEERRRAEEKRESERAKLRQLIAAKRLTLNKLRPELTSDAIAARDEEIARLEGTLAADQRIV